MATIKGTVFGDLLYGTYMADYIYGYEGNDELYGLGGNDWIYGGSGNDWMYGGSGNDYLFGDIGNDVLSGETGDDRLYGESGNDRLYGDDGNDYLSGGANDDQLYGGAGNDGMYGGTGNDRYWVDSALDLVAEFAGEGYDIVYSTIDYTLGANVESVHLLDAGGAIDATGNAAANSLWGNDFNNTLTGLGGNDELRGWAGNDTMFGDAGNDWLFGGAGADQMSGGPGADIFVIEGANETSAWIPFVTIYDHITDFSTAQGDRIDVSAIDANSLVAGNQAFAYIGAGAFTGAAGQLRYVGGFVQGDLNGDATADFMFETNAASLAATDFML